MTYPAHNHEHFFHPTPCSLRPIVCTQEAPQRGSWNHWSTPCCNPPQRYRTPPLGSGWCPLQSWQRTPWSGFPDPCLWWSAGRCLLTMTGPAAWVGRNCNACWSGVNKKDVVLELPFATNPYLKIYGRLLNIFFFPTVFLEEKELLTGINHTSP